MSAYMTTVRDNTKERGELFDIYAFTFYCRSFLFLLGPVGSSSGSTVSDYGLDDRGSIPDRGRVFFF
jgi:hypothetical protein